MKIEWKADDAAGIEHRCMVVLATKDGDLINGPEAVAEQAKAFGESGELGKSFGGSVYVTDPKGVEAQRLLIFNVGEKLEKDNDLRRATARAWKALRGKGIQEILFSLDGLEGDDAVRAAVEGFILGDYQFTELKSEKDKLPGKLETLTLHDTRDYRDKVARWQKIARGTERARDLCQMPANHLYPESLAEKVLAWSEECGYKASVLTEEECRKAGMGAMISVAQGSDRDGRFIITEYEPEQPSGKTVVLVGKAVTFDSGGLSLKPGANMPEMKGDMGGGATVIGTMSVLRDAGCPHRVIGLVPAVENMPSAKATRPSDVVTSLSGLTVEINNTDAEGRLIMADALTYAKRYNPDFVVDFATLTGACLVALGPYVCAVMGNHQPLVDGILEAGQSVYENFWQLPLVDEYNEFLKSETADVSNISSTRWGGTITAGLFLQRFAGDFQWAHCDIAPGLYEKATDYHPSGGIGVGVRMNIEMLNSL
ncbi:MAG: leucyl aminopeptidase [Acidobacteriota bacterium]|nr:leucyl aminopeptidase [Acidobacteriota bacterium]